MGDQGVNRAKTASVQHRGNSNRCGNMRTGFGCRHADKGGLQGTGTPDDV
jgi:hypothetical protein